jgi:hypothetical protein
MTSRLESGKSQTIAEGAATMERAQSSVAASGETDALAIFAQEVTVQAESQMIHAIPADVCQEPPPPPGATPSADLSLGHGEASFEDDSAGPSIHGDVRRSVALALTGRKSSGLSNHGEPVRRHGSRAFHRLSGFAVRLRRYLGRRPTTSASDATVSALQGRARRTRAQLDGVAAICQKESARIEALLEKARYLDRVVSSLEMRIRQVLDDQQALAFGTATPSCFQPDGTPERFLVDEAAAMVTQQNLPIDAISVLETVSDLRRRATTEGFGAVAAKARDPVTPPHGASAHSRTGETGEGQRQDTTWNVGRAAHGLVETARHPETFTPARLCPWHR